METVSRSSSHDSTEILKKKDSDRDMKSDDGHDRAKKSPPEAKKDSSKDPKASSSKNASGSEAEDDDDGDDEPLEKNGQPLYSVEKVLKVTGVKPNRDFLIKWEGYDESENTWEPECGVIHLEIVKEFLAQKASKHKVESAKEAERHRMRKKERDDAVRSRHEEKGSRRSVESSKKPGTPKKLEAKRDPKADEAYQRLRMASEADRQKRLQQPEKYWEDVSEELTKAAHQPQKPVVKKDDTVEKPLVEKPLNPLLASDNSDADDEPTSKREKSEEKPRKSEEKSKKKPEKEKRKRTVSTSDDEGKKPAKASEVEEDEATKAKRLRLEAIKLKQKQELEAKEKLIMEVKKKEEKTRLERELKQKSAAAALFKTEDKTAKDKSSKESLSKDKTKVTESPVRKEIRENGKNKPKKIEKPVEVKKVEKPVEVKKFETEFGLIPRKTVEKRELPVEIPFSDSKPASSNRDARSGSEDHSKVSESFKELKETSTSKISERSKDKFWSNKNVINGFKKPAAPSVDLDAQVESEPEQNGLSKTSACSSKESANPAPSNSFREDSPEMAGKGRSCSQSN